MSSRLSRSRVAGLALALTGSAIAVVGPGAGTAAADGQSCPLFSAIDASWSTYAVTTGGAVWSAGYGSASGELGDGSTVSRSTPGPVPGLADVVEVGTGYRSAVARTADGSVWAWGLNYSGELGDGTTAANPNPTRISSLSGVIDIAVASHVLAVKADGTVWAWGFNNYGAIGDGTTTPRRSPVQVPGLSGITAVAAGNHSLALASDGTVWAWGGNVNERTATAAVRVSSWQESPSRLHLCVRADGAVAGGGRLVVDAGGSTLQPVVGTGSDLAACAVNVVSQGGAVPVSVRRSAGTSPATLCVSVNGVPMTVTAGVTGSLVLPDVAWVDDSDLLG